MTPEEFHRVIRLPHTKDKFAKWQLMADLCYASFEEKWPEFPSIEEPKFSTVKEPFGDMRMSIDFAMETGSVPAGKEKCHLGMAISEDDMINNEITDEDKFCVFMNDRLDDMVSTCIRGVHDLMVEHNASSS